MNVSLKYQGILPFIEAKKFHSRINSGIKKSCFQIRESDTEKTLSCLLDQDITFKGTDIKARTVLAEIAGAIGFGVIGFAKRDIVRDSRMMPVSHKSERNGIEARMHKDSKRNA